MAQTVEDEIGASMAYEARKRAWAQHHGLRSVPHPCLSKLLGRRCPDERGLSYEGEACILHRAPHPDHDTLWRPAAQGRAQAVLYLNQPYNFDDEDCAATQALCDEHGLAWTIDPAAAWHYPAHVAGVVIWNPARYTYQPGASPTLPPPDPVVVQRRAAAERRQRSKSRSAYDTLCRALDALFYPDAPEGRTVADLMDSEEEAGAALHAPLTDADLEAIAARCRGVTPGPWHWTQDVVNEYLRNSRSSKRSRDLYLYILQGRGQRYQDSWDANVLRLQWSQIKGDTFCGSPSQADAAFIAAARFDVPRLLAEVLRLRARLAENDGQQ